MAGQRLEEFLKSKGIAKGFVAMKMGLSRNGFYKKLKGQSPFTSDDMKKLIEILSLSQKETFEIFLS